MVTRWKDMLLDLVDELDAVAGLSPEEAVRRLADPRQWLEPRLADARAWAAQEVIDAVAAQRGDAWGAQYRAAKRLGMTDHALSSLLQRIRKPDQAS